MRPLLASATCIALLGAAEPVAVRLQVGHAGGIGLIASGGATVATAGEDGRVIAWDAASWLELRTVGRLPTRAAALCGAGAWTVAADAAGGLHAWPAEGAEVAAAAAGEVADLAGFADGLVAAATATGIRWWRPADAAAPVDVALPIAPVARLAVAPDGALLAVGGGGLAALDPGATAPRWSRPELAGEAVAISADGLHLAVAAGSDLRVADMGAGKIRIALPGAAPPRPQAGAKLQPGPPRRIAAGLGLGHISDLVCDGDRVVVAQAMHQGLYVVPFGGGAADLPLAHCWPDRLLPLGGGRLAVASHQSPRPLPVDLAARSGAPGGAEAVSAFGARGLWSSADGRWLAYGCFRGEIRLWDLQAARLHQRVGLDPRAAHVFLDQARRADGLIAVAWEIEDPHADTTTGIALIDPRSGGLSGRRAFEPALGAPLAVASAPDGGLSLITTDFRSRMLAVRVAADGSVTSADLQGLGKMQLDAWRPGLDPVAGTVAMGGHAWIGLWDLASGAARWTRSGDDAPAGEWASWFVPDGTAVWAASEREIGRWTAEGSAQRQAADGAASRQGEWNDLNPLLVAGAAWWRGEADGGIRRWRDGAAQPPLAGAQNLAVTGLQLLPDGTLASAADDGSVALWLPGGGWVLLYADARDWVVAGDDGMFDGSPGCGRLLALSTGRRAAGIDQFAAARNRPDLVLQRLGHADAGYLALLRAAHERRLARLGGAAEAGFDGLPEARLAAPAVAGASATVNASLAAARGLARWQLWLDGIPQVPEAEQAASGASAEVSRALALPPGPHRVEVSCTDRAGRESLRAAVAIDGPAPSGLPDLHVLAVGISRYKSPGLDLGFAHQDAIDLAAALQRAAPGKLFAAVHATVLTDAQATAAGIRAAGAALAASRPGDTVVVLVAGHGAHAADGTWCLLTHDCDPADLVHTGLPFADLEALIGAAPALRRLVLVDACESGERDAPAATALVAAAAPAAGRGRGLRRAAAAPGLRREERFVFNDLRRRTGAVVLSSSTGDQLSYERDEFANGLFTQAILECLAGAGDADHDGTITQHELRDAVARRVSELSGNLQTPVIDRDNLLADLRLPVLAGLTP